MPWLIFSVVYLRNSFILLVYSYDQFFKKSSLLKNAVELKDSNPTQTKSNVFRAYFEQYLSVFC